MTADIDLWVTATILRELRNNGMITQKEAEKNSFPCCETDRRDAYYFRLANPGYGFY